MDSDKGGQVIHELCEVFRKHHLRTSEATSAMLTIMIPALIETGLTKERAIAMFGESWDELMPAYRTFTASDWWLQL